MVKVQTLNCYKPGLVPLSSISVVGGVRKGIWSNLLPCTEKVAHTSHVTRTHMLMLNTIGWAIGEASDVFMRVRFALDLWHFTNVL